MSDTNNRWRCPYCDGLNDWQNEICEICGDGRRSEAVKPAADAETTVPKTYTPRERAETPPPAEKRPDAPPTPEKRPEATPEPEPPKKKRPAILWLLVIGVLAYGGGKLLGGQMSNSMSNSSQPRATRFVITTPAPTPRKPVQKPTKATTPRPTLAPTKAPTPRPTLAATPEPATLKQGDSGFAVAILQAELVERNYLADTADGVFGGKTAAAIKQVQAEAGLQQTGVADAATQGYLMSHTGPFKPSKDADLLMYAASYSLDDHRLYLFLKNNGRQDITRLQVNLEQCNANKAAMGSFYGVRNTSKNTYWSYQYWTSTLRSGEADDRYVSLREGDTVIFDDGSVNTVTFFDGAQYARITLKEYTTADGKKHSVNQVLYCPFR